MPATTLVVKATAPQLNRHMHAGDAFKAIANSCIAHVAANREGVVAQDGESVHQMRVALRRFKSACRLFRRQVPLPVVLAGELAWLAGELGPARDWDVLTGATLPVVAAHAPAGPGRESLALLQERAGDAARRHRDAAAAAAASSRFDAFADLLGGWVDGIDGGATPVATFARKAVARDRKRLARRARHLARADAPARHALRIAAKKSRYDGEFFLSLHNSKASRRQLRRLAAMQDVLGSLNDATVARTLLAELAELGDDPALALGAGFVQGFLSAGQEEGVRKAVKLWRKLERD